MSEKPLRLHRHEELVEAMARANAKRYGEDASLSVDDIWAFNSKYFLEEATAALDALLEAAVRLGVGQHVRKNPAYEKSTNSQSFTIWEFPSLILRMEASDDK